MKHNLRAIICGSRENLTSAGVENVAATLNAIQARLAHYDARISVVIEGGAAGIDSIASKWGRSASFVSVKTFRADWKSHGKAAGPIRNSTMLQEGQPHFVIAFPGGKGTANMVALARKAGVHVVDLMDADRTIDQLVDELAAKLHLPESPATPDFPVAWAH